jgi:hypothetical protein
LAAATVCLVFSAAIGLAFPQIVRHLLDAAFVRHDGGMLNRIAISLTGLFVLQALSNFTQTYPPPANGSSRSSGRTSSDICCACPLRSSPSAAPASS